MPKLLDLGGGWGLGINQDKDNLNLMELLGFCKDFPSRVSIFLVKHCTIRGPISEQNSIENFPGLLAWLAD